MAAFAAPAGGAPLNPNGSFVVPEPPDDTVSRLRFSPPTIGNFLLAASWNGSVRVWQADMNSGAKAVAMSDIGAPILDACWAADGRTAFCAAADNIVKQWDPSSGATKAVAAHDAPVRCVHDVPDLNYLVTGSWDKSVKYWDVRAPTGKPEGSVAVDDRVYAMDVRGPLMVVALAQRAIVVFDVRKPAEPFLRKYSQLRFQTRCVTTFPDSMGYMVGSVGGKASVDHVQEQSRKNDFVFGCHRGDDGRAYAVNAIRFHRQSGALVTAGSDGNVCFWDKERKKSVTTIGFEKMGAPVCDIDFSHDGTMYAYAVGYDWARGSIGASGVPTAVFVQTIRDGELVLNRDNRSNGVSRGGRGGSRGGYRGRGRRGDRGRGRGRGQLMR